MFGGDHKIKRLEQIPMLSLCSNAELRTIASTGDMLAVEAGDVLRRGGGSDRSFVLVLEGDADVDAGARRLHIGDSYGAVSALTSRPETGEVRMLTPGRVLIFSARQFRSAIRRIPGFAAGLATELAARVG